MNGIDPHFNALNTCDLEDEPASSAYTFLLLLTGLAVATYTFARFAESKNHLNYENRFARITAGILTLMMNMLHTKNGDLEITEAKNKLIAIGPHRTSWEALVVATKIKGTPPRFFATDSFNTIPGVPSFMKMFKVIQVASQAKKENGRSSNSGALEKASQVLDEHGCIALFPQGNFAKLGQEPPRVYTGAAQIALKHQIPIHVVRLDGFWSLQNPIIPVFVRNNAMYRAFFSMFHMNNVKTNLCCVIDSHLKPENANLSDAKKIELICAEMYSYYRHTQELTVEQIDAIKTESPDTRLRIWENKLAQDELRKQLTTLKKEEAELETTTVSVPPR